MQHWLLRTFRKTVTSDMIWWKPLKLASNKSYLPTPLCYLHSPPRWSCFIKMLSIIPWNLACLKTYSHSRFLSVTCNPIFNCHFFIILTCILLPAGPKWIKSRPWNLCTCSWHVHHITHNWCTTSRQLCSNLHHMNLLSMGSSCFNKLWKWKVCHIMMNFLVSFDLWLI